MKTGRNDPCPCGSGKKYKKCCLARDQEAAATRAAEIAAAPPRQVESAEERAPEPSRRWTTADVDDTPPAPLPRDPADERADAVWHEFEAADDEGRIEIFLKALDDAEVMDGQMAYGMLQVLHNEAIASGHRTRFATWVDALRERQPAAFAHEAPYFLSWCLKDALAEGLRDRVGPLALELAATAGKDIDTFERMTDVLAFHGHLDAIVAALRSAWPLVQASEKVVPWGITEFAEKGVSYEIFEYVEHTAAPDPADPRFLERVRFFIDDPREDRLRAMIEDLTGKSTREWKAEDFVLKSSRKKRRDDWDEDEHQGRPSHTRGAANLARLIGEFVGYLRREERVPYPRGELVREELLSYFMRRQKSELDPRPSMLEQMMNPGLKLPKPPPPVHQLCPERVTLESHLAGMMAWMNGLDHRAAALFLAMPAWLRFLKSRGLIDDAISQRVIAELVPLHESLLRIWKRDTADPSLYQQGQEWLESARGELV